MNLTVVTAPAIHPVGVGECKRDLRITEDDQDVYLNELIAEATGHIDGPFGVVNRALITQQWKLTISSMPRCIEIPLTPVQSIDTIEYYDSDNVSQTYPASNYILTGDYDTAEIEATDTASLPSVYDRPDAVSITFTAGYGSDAENVPGGIRRAIRVLVSHWFENPAISTPDSNHAVPVSFDSLIADYQRGVVG